MNLNFSQIVRNSLGQIDPPVLELKTLNEDTIGLITNHTAPKFGLNYNEISTISFDVSAFNNGVPTPYYDNISSMTIVQADPYGIYILNNPEIEGDGTREVKKCTGNSLEVEFNRKNVVLAAGTYKLYSVLDMISEDPQTIMGIIHQLMPDWTVTVDLTLNNLYRTFDDTDVKIYDWMMNTAQKSFGCLFIFDCYTRTIHVKDANTVATTLPIYLSYENLIKTITIKEDVDNLFTVLSVYGADPLNIRSVNPTGTNKIYNIDYYIARGDITSGTVSAWNAWIQAIAAQQEYYTGLQLLYSSATARLLTEKSKLLDLHGELSALGNSCDVALQAYNNNIGTYATYQAYKNQYDSKTVEIANKESEITGITNEITNPTTGYLTLLQAVVSSLDMDTYFTVKQMSELNRYFSEDKFVDDTFATFDVDITGNSDNFYSTTVGSLSFTGSTIDEIDMSIVDPSNLINKRLFRIENGSVSILDTSGSSTFDFTANIISGSFERHNSTGKTVATFYVGSGTNNSDYFLGGTLTLVCTVSSFTSLNSTVTLGVSSVYFTPNATEMQKYNVSKELYDFASEQLVSISQPVYEFNLKCANFIFAEGFEKFKDALRLGSAAYLKLSESNIVEPMILGINLNFESPDDFDIVFSNRYRHGKTNQMQDLLSETYSTAKTLDMSKYNYNSYARSGADSEVKKLMTDMQDAATRAILSGKNQGTTIDGSGITTRDMSGTYSDYIKLNNGMIGMFDGVSETAKIGIGRFYDSNRGSMFGIIAPNIVGTLLAGEELLIQSSKTNAAGVSTFRVDENGAALYNSQFDLVKETGSGGSATYYGKMSLDPAWGFYGGAISSLTDLIYYSGSTPMGVKTYQISSPSTYSYATSISNANGTPIASGYLPKANFWIDMYGDAFFRGKVYATSGEFTGKITATDSSFSGSVTANSGTIGGWTLASNLLYSGASTGYVGLNSNISDTYAMWCGNATAASAPFRVSRAGALSASGATLSGAITATSGSITGTLTLDTNGKIKFGNTGYEITANGINLAGFSSYVDTTDNTSLTPQRIDIYDGYGTNYGYLKGGSGYDPYTNALWLYGTYALKLFSQQTLSLDSNTTLSIGYSSPSVTIGGTGVIININGTVRINGVLQ